MSPDPADSHRYDVAVIGAGPAGAEATLAAAAAGAACLCLAINLDSVGYPPAGPVLCESRADPRHELLRELHAGGGRLPVLLENEDVRPRGSARAAKAAVPDPWRDTVVVDRRNLGLAYKEALENEPGADLRQALVTALVPNACCETNPPDPMTSAQSGYWRVETKLGEVFLARAVVVATGTFLHARVDGDGGQKPGGRRGEIASNALADCLGKLGIELEQIEARAPARVHSRALSDSRATNGGAVIAANEPDLVVGDGTQMHEICDIYCSPRGNVAAQLQQIETKFYRHFAGADEGSTGAGGGPTDGASVWMTRASYSVRHEVLRGGQVSEQLQALQQPGLFFAGRTAGVCNYCEAAGSGLVAGRTAARWALCRRGERAEGSQDPAGKTPAVELINKLCVLISKQDIRPVTIRIEGPGC